MTLSLTAVTGAVLAAFRKDALQIPEEEACVCPLVAFDEFLFANTSLVTDKRNARWHQNKALGRQTFDGFEEDMPRSDSANIDGPVSSDESGDHKTEKKVQSDGHDTRSVDQASEGSFEGFPDDEAVGEDHPLAFDEPPEQKAKMPLATMKRVATPTPRRRRSV